MKLRRNLLPLLLTMSFLIALILTSISPAFALSENYTLSSPGVRDLPDPKGIFFPPTNGYTVLSFPRVADNEVGAFGTVFLRVIAGCLKDGDIVSFRLPDGLVWSKSGMEDTPMTNSDWAKVSDNYNNAYGQMDGNYILVPQAYSGDDNALDNVDLEVTMLSEREIRVQIIGEPSSEYNAYLYIFPKHVWVEEGYSGRVNLIAEAPPSSGFPSDTIAIGDVNFNGGRVSVSVTSVDTFRDNDEITLRVTEVSAGCLNPRSESLKLKLPSGFAWSNVNRIQTIWGDSDFVKNGITINIDEDELIMDVSGESESATNIEFKVTINVDNRVFARPGVVVVKVSGASSVSPSRLWVGEYNPYDLNGDESTDILDLLLLNQLLNDAPVGDNEKADVNYDGKIDILDLLTVAQNIY
jgi:hypothetical protein